ncbi:M48 family metallopeptidase [Clostridium vincentii]|nr:SprT family zinc-dependent metalloprotease [Clostridium vincentii]
MKRKTMLISIESDGSVILKLPIMTKKDEIDKMIKSKEKWILNKVELVKSRTKLKIDEILYLGVAYNYKVIIQRFLTKDFIYFNGDTFYVNVKDEKNTEKVLELWFRDICEKLVHEKVEKYKRTFGILPKEIKIKTQKSRWGSCSYDNKLMLNWKLIMASEESLEYVVVHEMCHMIHKNHSKEYWNLVSEILPTYKVGSEWLKNNGYLLYL